MELTYRDGWFKGFDYIADDDSPNQEEYKRMLAEDSGYPSDEWWRVRGIEVVELMGNGIKVRVTFMNPGKCIEEGLEVTEGDWETFRRIRDKYKHGELSTETQSQEPATQEKLNSSTI